MLPARYVPLLGLTIASLASLPACAPADDTVACRQALGQLAQPIQGGYKDTADTAVMYIVMFSGSNLAGCTGTLIASNVVLTAQHCVAPVYDDSMGVKCGQTTFGSPYNANNLYVTAKSTFTYNVSDYYVGKEVVIPPGNNEFCGRDQAIIILSKPVPPEVAVPMVPRVDEPLLAQELYSAIGYGATYDSPNAPSGTRYRRDDLLVDCVADECPSFYVKVTEWIGDTGVCSGDSGGPAIDSLNRVTGVASRGSAGCETPIYGYVYGWAEWIKETTAYAASLIGEPPPTWVDGWPTDPGYYGPVGEPCGGPEECPTGFCLDGYCTRLCNDIALCPEGFFCNPDQLCQQNDEPPPEPPPDPDPGGGANPAEPNTTVSQCGLSTVQPAGTDPTKPIPWGLLGLTIGWLAVRRRTH